VNPRRPQDLETRAASAALEQRPGGRLPPWNAVGAPGTGLPLERHPEWKPGAGAWWTFPTPACPSKHRPAWTPDTGRRGGRFRHRGCSPGANGRGLCGDAGGFQAAREVSRRWPRAAGFEGGRRGRLAAASRGGMGGSAAPCPCYLTPIEKFCAEKFCSSGHAGRRRCSGAKRRALVWGVLFRAVHAESPLRSLKVRWPRRLTTGTVPGTAGHQATATGDSRNAHRKSWAWW